MKKKLKVQYNYHVQVLGNYYSSPYQYYGKTVDVTIKAKQVVMHYDEQLICAHQRIYGKNRYQTNRSHMPPKDHEGCWSSSKFRSWAYDIGTNTYEVVNRILQFSPVEQQGYKSIMAILQLSRRYGKETVDKACEYSMIRCLFPLYKDVINEVKLIRCVGIAGQP